MTLKTHYSQLYQGAIAAFHSNNYEIDPWLDSDTDDRFGLSLIIRPTDATKQKIQKFLKEIEYFEPNQYYYPNPDIHVTVISIISCYSGLKLSQLPIPEYICIIENCLKNLPPIHITFKGVTASPSCVMIQGFMAGNGLNMLRDRLRQAFKNSGLEESMDERYHIQTAHATVFRFKEPLRDKNQFIQTVERYRDFDFGVFRVEAIELVFNNWYHQEASVVKLHQFNPYD